MLATTPHDNKEARAFLRMHNRDDEEALCFPLVIARRDGEVIGICGTHPTKQAVVIGDLFVDPDQPRPGIIVMRLLEAYEVILRRAGISYFYGPIEHDNEKWINILERTGAVERVQEDDRFVWFKRSLINGQRVS